MEIISDCSGSNPVRLGVTGHEREYKGTIVLGRLINHSKTHPNLQYYIKKYGDKNMRTRMIVFEAITDIKVRNERDACQSIVSSKQRKVIGVFIYLKAGEQLLWDYGPQYQRSKLIDQCICNQYSPHLVEGKP